MLSRSHFLYHIDTDRNFHASVNFCSLLKSNKCFDCVLIFTSGENFYDIFAGCYRWQTNLVRCESLRWLISESLCTISDIIFCVAMISCSHFSICHTQMLSHRNERTKKSEKFPFKLLKRCVSHGPQLLNMLLWNYNPEQLNSHTKNDTTSLILIYFTTGADKFCFWRVRTIYFIISA